MTHITVEGRVGTEPKLSYTPNGAAVLNFTLAEDHRSKNVQTGAWETVGTTWRNVSVWKRGLMDPEYLHDVIHKGDLILVSGAERLREWEGRDGTKGKSLEVSASMVASPIIRPKPGADADWAANPQQSPAPAQPAQAQQVSAWPTAPAGGFQQQDDPWTETSANEAPPF